MNVELMYLDHEHHLPELKEKLLLTVSKNMPQYTRLALIQV
jgi:hypothetical protein